MFEVYLNYRRNGRRKIVAVYTRYGYASYFLKFRTEFYPTKPGRRKFLTRDFARRFR